MPEPPPTITIKRIYDDPAVNDGYRVLIDRLWPRGVSRDVAALDAWMKDLAPSTELRRWFDHDRARFAAFTAAYREELDAAGAAIETVFTAAADQPITLLYAANDPVHNHAVVLRDYLRGQR